MTAKPVSNQDVLAKNEHECQCTGAREQLHQLGTIAVKEPAIRISGAGRSACGLPHGEYDCERSTVVGHLAKSLSGNA